MQKAGFLIQGSNTDVFILKMEDIGIVVMCTFSVMPSKDADKIENSAVLCWSTLLMKAHISKT